MAAKPPVHVISIHPGSASATSLQNSIVGSAAACLSVTLKYDASNYFGCYLPSRPAKPPLLASMTERTEPLRFRQPFKGLYILQRVLSTLILIPCCTIKYCRTSARPRQTWTLNETSRMMMLQRIMWINEVTGIMLECTDKTKEMDPRSLQETSFVWLPPVEDPLANGTAKCEDVKPARIPGYLWPQGTNLAESQGYVWYWANILRFVYARI